MSQKPSAGYMERSSQVSVAQTRAEVSFGYEDDQGATSVFNRVRRAANYSPDGNYRNRLAPQAGTRHPSH